MPMEGSRRAAAGGIFQLKQEVGRRKGAGGRLLYDPCEAEGKIL